MADIPPYFSRSTVQLFCGRGCGSVDDSWKLFLAMVMQSFIGAFLSARGSGVLWKLNTYM